MPTIQWIYEKNLRPSNEIKCNKMQLQPAHNCSAQQILSNNIEYTHTYTYIVFVSCNLFCVSLMAQMACCRFHFI